MTIDDDLRAFENTVTFLLAETAKLSEAAKRTKNKKLLAKIHPKVVELTQRMQQIKREFDSKYPME